MQSGDTTGVPFVMEDIMGNRAEAQLKFGEEGSIYLYTHSTGHRVPTQIRNDLTVGKERFGDPTYLARIIVSQVVRDEWDQNLGYGLSPYPIDTEYPQFTVDMERDTVTIGDKVWGFDLFMDLTDEELRSAWMR